MKYIHTYNTVEEFEAVYNNDASTLVISFDCELGRFTFDRELYVEAWDQTVYCWTNGEVILDTEVRNPIVGDSAYNDDPDGDGTPFEPGDDDDYQEYGITAVQTEEPESGYFEPWVSLTRENEAVHYNKLGMLNFQPEGYFTRADFGITQEMIDNWIEIYENHGSLEEYGVLVFSNPITNVYKSTRLIIFYSGEPRAYIGLSEDYVDISLTDGDK